ncbi:hypothetical protein IIA16_05700 [bacterium]|nr:hypothetical protein [bacterium]
MRGEAWPVGPLLFRLADEAIARSASKRDSSPGAGGRVSPVSGWLPLRPSGDGVRPTLRLPAFTRAQGVPGGGKGEMLP